MQKLNDTEKATLDHLAGQEVGYLGISLENGYPRVVPVNFVFLGDEIYFHGSLKGEKHDILAKQGKVSITIADALAVVPAHWYSDRGCGANHFFQSMTVYGKSSVVEDIELKAQVLEALNQKYIPEGGHLKITTEEPFYEKPLRYTGVFRISPELVTFRDNIAGSYSDEKKERLVNALKKRNSPVDLRTIERIEGTSK